MRHVTPVCLLLLLALGWAQAPAPAAEPAPIRVLIVDGYSNHDWRLTTALIRGILEPTGRFTVTVATAPATKDAPGWDTWRPKFSDHDVVIQTCNDLGGGPRWPRAVEEDFETFVRNGGGVYVWHAGNNAFAGWPAYNEMIGLGWRQKDFGWALAVGPDGKVVRIPAGEGRDTGHGARLDTVVKRLGDHPIHAGLPRSWLTPDIEVYYYARGPAQNLEVLSHGYDPQTKEQWPLKWTVTHGRGRVYTSTFGHVWKGDTQPARMRCAGLQTVVVRALQWLAGRPADFPVPADFPTAEKVSVRGEIPLPGPRSVAITVHADRPTTTLRPIWNYFGYDEALTTLTPEGRHLLGELNKMTDKEPIRIRVHHLHTSGDGTLALKWSSTNVYTEDKQGNPVLDWTRVDAILDELTRPGLEPFIEVSFMPQALSAQPEPYTPTLTKRGLPAKDILSGGAYHPPKDHRKWQAFIEAWVRHCVERYGRKAVASWLWELWNEPESPYFKGTVADYCRLYDHFAAAVKAVVPEARVGAPHTTDPAWKRGDLFMEAFLEHCRSGRNAATGGTGAPLDFIGYHAKGLTRLDESGRVEMNLRNHLATIDLYSGIIARFPGFAALPVYIGESDPEGCAGCPSTLDPQRDYRRTSQFASYTAASFMRKQDLAAGHGGNLQGAVSWAFTFHDQPWFNGLRALTTNEIALPVFNAFKLFARLGPMRIESASTGMLPPSEILARSVRGAPDLGVVGTRTDAGALRILVWNYHDVAAGFDAPTAITLKVTGLTAGHDVAAATLTKIDQHHANAFTAWLAQGEPQAPTPAQIAGLHAAATLRAEPLPASAQAAGSADFDLRLLGQSVALIEIPLKR